MYWGFFSVWSSILMFISFSGLLFDPSASFFSPPSYSPSLSSALLSSFWLLRSSPIPRWFPLPVPLPVPLLPSSPETLPPPHTYSSPWRGAEYNARIRGLNASVTPQPSDRHRSYSFSGSSHDTHLISLIRGFQSCDLELQKHTPFPPLWHFLIKNYMKIIIVKLQQNQLWCRPIWGLF